MESFRAVIVDDEELLRNHLRNLLREIWPELVICGEAGSGNQAVALIQAEQPDIAFLDIRMPDLSGLEVAARLPENCLVVFITAYDQYAIEAFEKAAVDYLLKPLTAERLTMTSRRLRQRLREPTANNQQLAAGLEDIRQQMADCRPRNYLEWLRVADGGAIILLPVDEVSFFRANDKYTEVMTSAAEYLIRTSIKQLTLELDPERFWQIHRKTIVNVGKITGVTRSLTGRFIVNLTDRPEPLTVSRPFSHLFRQM